jgi:hypothetical protein
MKQRYREEGQPEEQEIDWNAEDHQSERSGTIAATAVARLEEKIDFATSG